MKTESHIFAVPASGGTPRALTAGRSLSEAVEVSPDGKWVAIARENPTAPRDIWVCAADGSGARTLTTLNPQVSRMVLAATDVIRWKGADDWEIEGVLVKAAAGQPGKRVPLIVEPHGGPHGRVTVGFNPTWQYFAGRGFTILAPNFRGSAGYPQAFVDADRRDWGGGDYVDIMKGVDHVVDAGWADPERLAVEGYSYGGYMTAWIIGHTTRFKAAVMGAGMSNLVSFHGTTDIQRFIEWEFTEKPWDDSALLLKHSPISYAANVRTPTLIVHGLDDIRVPPEQGQQFYTVLKKLGVTVQLVRYPRHTHQVRTEPSHRRDRLERTLEWIERHVGGSEELAAPRVRSAFRTRRA